MKFIKSIITLALCFTTVIASSKTELETKAPVSLEQIHGLDFYYNLSEWLGNLIAEYFRKKILAESQNFNWSPITSNLSKSSPKMYFDKSKIQINSSESVDFWGLEESSIEVSEEGVVLPRPSVAYRYNFNCSNPTKSKLMYAIKFSQATGMGNIEFIDTHFNGHWWNYGNELVDQSLSNFKPFFSTACKKTND